ncbi:MAG: glycosyltransferase [Anaerolineae bacterium]
MKIGLILPGFSAGESDWCIPAQLNLVRRLACRAEVHVFPLRYPHHRRPYTVYGAAVHPQGGAEIRGVGRAALLARTLTAVAAEHRRRPFDILHGMWADEPGFIAVAAGRLLGVPAVVSLLGGELVGLPDIGYGGQLSLISRWLTRVALRQATQVTAGSAYLRRLARPLVPPDRLLPIPIGVDTDLFHPGPANPGCLAEGEVRLLHVGSLVPVKDQATLLRAFSRVVSQIPDAHLHIVGDGPLRHDLERLAELLGIAPKVTFHGAVPHERMPACYRAADLCVLSSRHEGQELVTLEAAACGRATVGTAVGLLPDLAPASQVAPVGDAQALVDALLEVIQDPQAITAMGQASREAVEAGYTLEQTVARLVQLYAGLAGV